MTTKISSPDLYEKIREMHMLGDESFTTAQLDAVMEHESSMYEKMPSAKSFLDWCRRNHKITSSTERGEYYWTDAERFPAPSFPDGFDDGTPDTPVYPSLEPGYNVAMVLVSSPKAGYRIPRKLKKALKKETVSVIVNEFGAHQVNAPRTTFIKAGAGMYFAQTTFLVK